MSTAQTQTTSASVEYTLSVNTDKSTNKIRQLESVAVRTLSIIGRFTNGNPDLDKFISLLIKVIATIRALQAAIMAFEASSGPIGWALLGIGIAGTVISGYDIMTTTVGA